MAETRQADIFQDRRDGVMHLPAPLSPSRIVRHRPDERAITHAVAPVAIVIVLGLMPTSPHARAAGDALTRPGRQQRIFPYTQAEQARRLAREECKPLVMHFVPDTELGADQLERYYTGQYRIPEHVLEKLVIVVVPSEQFAKLKHDLGVTGAGGYRTISAYDLSPFDEKSVPTCRSGFR